MKKPEFPKPRLIHEDFLSEQDPMKNYRIKKVRQDGRTYYYPQKKVLFWWECIFGVERGNYFDTLEEAKYYLKQLLSADTKPVVEYLEVNCEETK